MLLIQFIIISLTEKEYHKIIKKKNTSSRIRNFYGTNFLENIIVIKIMNKIFIYQKQ